MEQNKASEKDISLELKAAASRGGKARANALTSDEVSSISRKAAEVKWAKAKLVIGEDAGAPKATHAGRLTLSDLVLPCAVLDNGMRVLSERGVVAALGGKRGGSHWRRLQNTKGSYLPVFISAKNLAPYIPSSLAVALANPVIYRAKNGGVGYGVIATLLPEICEVWLKARRDKALVTSQEHIAHKAEILISGLAQVGIIALVDEATGYQEVRDREELHRILEAYVSKELLPWSKRFPDEFYKELFRLKGWVYSPPSPKRPKVVSKLTSELVYEKLPPGVLEELRTKNPVVKNGRRKYKHHMFLTEEIGDKHLEKQVSSVTTLMRASPSWAIFTRLFERAFPPAQKQGKLPLDFGDSENIE